MNWHELLKDSRACLAMKPSELGAALLDYFRRLPSSQRQLLHAGNLANAHSTYPEELRRAIMEAWQWLLREGLLIPDIQSLTPGFYQLSRTADQLDTSDSVPGKMPIDATSKSPHGIGVPTSFETTFATYTRIPGGQLGEGGSGTVFKVRRTDGEVLALKLLKAQAATSDKLARFKNEIGFCSVRRHPNVLHVSDWGFIEVNGIKCPFYLMPLYPKTLRQVMSTLLPSDAIRMFAQILDGIEAAHLCNVWHRDLKPENILLDPTNGSLVLADFGIAHFHESLLATTVETQPQSRLANFQYAAPEQRSSSIGKVDHRVDIYALGLMLNELFTHHTPHGAGYARIADTHPEMAYLDELVEQMIQQSPESRPATIDAIKKLLIGAQNSFVVRQSLSIAAQVVAPITTPDDPLVRNPVQITSTDWRDNTLILGLHPAPNDMWRQTFASINYRTCMMGKDPSRYRFRPTAMTISASEGEAQPVLNDSKRFVEIANRDYAAEVARQAKAREAAERERLIRDRKEKEKRLRVLDSLRL